MVNLFPLTQYVHLLSLIQSIFTFLDPDPFSHTDLIWILVHNTAKYGSGSRRHCIWILHGSGSETLEKNDNFLFKLSKNSTGIQQTIKCGSGAILLRLFFPVFRNWIDPCFLTTGSGSVSGTYSNSTVLTKIDTKLESIFS